MAQEIEFLPSGVFHFSYEYQSTATKDYMAAGRERKSVREVLLDRNHMDEDDVDGSIHYQQNRQLLGIKYGLFDFLNLELVIPYIQVKRESSLDLTDNGSASQLAFRDSYDSTETQGTGDMALWFIWRLHYSDENDLHLGIGLDNDNGPYNYDDPDKLALGSGAQELSFYVKWLAYPRSTEMAVETETGITLTKNSEVRTDDDEGLTLKRQNNLYLQILLSFNEDILNWGGALRMNNRGETDIDGQGQGDGYVSYTTKLFFNLGNLYRLEEEPLAFPWTVGIYAERVFFGANAPDDQVSGLKASFYF